jgi:hypothetical protein
MVNARHTVFTPWVQTKTGKAVAAAPPLTMDGRQHPPTGNVFLMRIELSRHHAGN